mgnify:CR=1 FL=1
MLQVHRNGNMIRGTVVTMNRATAPLMGVCSTSMATITDKIMIAMAMLSAVKYRFMDYFYLSQYITREDNIRILCTINEMVGISTIQDLHAWA